MKILARINDHRYIAEIIDSELNEILNDRYRNKGYGINEEVNISKVFDQCHEILNNKENVDKIENCCKNILKSVENFKKLKVSP